MTLLNNVTPSCTKAIDVERPDDPSPAVPAATDHTTPSEIMRQALRSFLDVA